jgi:AcrR family transcriptional regulator
VRERALRADARDNRAKILDAARSAFEELGPEVNLREIARRAGVAQGTVHRHFPAKQALFSAIAVHRLKELAELARALGTQQPPGNGFLEFVSKTVEQARRNRSLSAVFDGAGSDSAVRAAEQEMSAALETLLAQAQAGGAIRDDIDLADVHAITAALLAVAAHPAASDTDRTRRIAVVLDGLRPQPS